LTPAGGVEGEEGVVDLHRLLVRRQHLEGLLVVLGV
jgi:hypothetical protein